MPLIQDRVFGQSIELDAFPQDYQGQLFQCNERTVDQTALWLGAGGSSQVWNAVTPSYVGPLSGIPAAANMRIGALAIIDETAAGGLTRPPASGTKMRRIRLVVNYGPDGATKNWYPDGEQVLFKVGGAVGNPACANFTSVAATGIISEIGNLPANLLSVNGAELWVRAVGGRSTTAVGTANFALALSPTSGTAGSAIAVSGTSAANTSAVVWIEGSMWTRTAAAQFATYTLAPGGASQNTSGTGAQSFDMTVAQTVQFVFSGATAGDIFNIPSFTVGIR